MHVIRLNLINDAHVTIKSFLLFLKIDDHIAKKYTRLNIKLIKNLIHLDGQFVQ